MQLALDNSGSNGEAIANAPAVRVLCLGNELLADDCLGYIVADRLRPFASPQAEIVSTSESGFHLLDYLLGVHRLIVLDTIQTGAATPGTIYQFRENDLQSVPGGSPHYIGLFETLALARLLGLPVAEEISILAVETADCLTVGGELHPEVRAAIPILTAMVCDWIHAAICAS
jgi:hydrogenase maturation protease